MTNNLAGDVAIGRVRHTLRVAHNDRLEVDGLGYEVFNVANADMSVAATTDQVRERFYDGVELRRPMGRNETGPWWRRRDEY